ncbi:MAG: carbon monoxide dehydrogenase subunit G [Bacteroidia bacterium]|jgi:carbon monoxide dehydrogenase subunit G|tara:strand:- start:7167 stop:7571 length:405 start_codon:yes stop_codon:yes gene_type:complete
MVKIESSVSKIKKSSEEVFKFLSLPANYESLMPSKVRSFSSTETDATLDIEGIGTVQLAITERVSPSKIIMLPQNKVPFKFDIQWNIKTLSDSESEVQAVINADLNFMMKMMAEKLLKDFLDVQVHKLTKELSV